MRYTIVALLVLFHATIALNAQSPGETDVAATTDSAVAEVLSRSDALNIFLDCDRCDRTYLRETIDFVNYVNDRNDADVFVMMTRRNTGSGGTEHIISLSGLGDYEGMNDTLFYFSGPGDPGDQTRRGQATMLSIGLMRFVARTPLAQHINISYVDPIQRAEGRGRRREAASARVVEDDPWNSWVFRISARGSYDKNEVNENININSSFSADRITPEWKSEYDANFSHRQRNIYSDGEVFRFPRKSWSMGTLQVKSLGSHFSAGGRASISSSSYGNTRLSVGVHPTIEYNIYPYSESFMRQIRVQYQIRVNYYDYMNRTIYQVDEETLFRQQLSVAASFNQPWGSSSFSIRGNHILNDPSFWSFNMRGNVSWRVYRGLSVNFNASASINRDDRDIPLGEASLEDVLAQIRRINSAYSYSASFGLSYSFGSIYNNVVNPRFTGR